MFVSHRVMEMEDFVEDCEAEIDEEYEFDASQFFDFTRPEVDSEIEEVERWFDVSGDYPNSPFIVKLDLEKILAAQGVGKSSKFRKSIKSISSSSDTDSSIKHGLPPSKKNSKGKGHLTCEDAAKPKAKAAYKSSQPRNAKFMEPTASHLAKQNTLHDKQRSSQLCTRFDRTRTKLDEKKSCIVSEIRATKRQKLETGFLKKGSYLRHKFSMSHKSSNKETVPREPELGTLQRSLSRRSKSSCESIKPHHSSNMKTSKARSLPRPRKSKTPLTEFQEFHFKTTERANYHSSAKENRSSTGESPLTEEFSKLSLGSKSKKTSESERRSSASSKSSGRSSRGSLQTESSWGSNQHCGARTRPHQPNITRSLDIR